MRKSNLAAAVCAALCGCDLLAASSGLPKAAPDKGGMTFDCKAISDERFGLSSLPSGDAPGNMFLADGVAAPLPSGYQEWHKVCNVHSTTVPSGSAWREGLRSHVEASRADGVLRVHKGEPLRDFCAAAGRTNLYGRVEGGWERYVRLPDANGGSYRFSFRYKMRHTLPQIGHGTRGIVIVHAWTLAEDGKGYRHVSRPAHPDLADGFDDWLPMVVDFDVPQGADIVSLKIRHDGVGDLLAKDVRLERRSPVQAVAGMSVRLSPAQLLDGVFAVSEGQCGHLTWEWRKDGEDGYDKKDSCVKLGLPPGFAFVGDTFAKNAAVAENADGSSVVTFTGLMRPYLPKKSFQSWNKPSILLKSTGKTGVEGECSLSFWRGDRKTGDSGPVRLVTVPRIRVASPERYLYGAMPGAGTTVSFRQREACEMLAGFLADIGVRMLVSGPGAWIASAHAEAYKRAFRAAGGRRIVPISPAVANGYHIGDQKDIPEGDRYVTDVVGNGEWSDYVRKGLCPLAVIEERPYFTEKVMPMLKRAVVGCDGLRANWEPFMFLHHGCYCAKCRARFAAWAKADESELAADWPKVVKPGAKYGREWTRFRSLEMAELVAVFDRRVKELTGGADSLGFIPAITWKEMLSTWRMLHPSPESEPFDYATRISTIGTWGPYVYWNASNPYVYSEGDSLLHFVVARDIREQADRDYPEGKRPQLLGGTQGLQCGEWITQPEWLEMAMDSYFFNGFDGAQAYFFPEGLDARYCAAYARSAARAAKYEKAVRDGRRNDGAVSLVPVAGYPAPVARVSGQLPNHVDVPLLQSAAYDFGGGRVVAVFNFWEKGEAAFDLRATGLSGNWAVVDETGIRYANPATSLSTWTAEELARGIRLKVGAARTRVFELRRN